MAGLYTIELNGVTKETYDKATDFIQANALRPEASAIDCEFPDNIDPNKAPELNEAVIRRVHAAL